MQFRCEKKSTDHHLYLCMHKLDYRRVTEKKYGFQLLMKQSSQVMKMVSTRCLVKASVSWTVKDRIEK